MRTPVQLHGTAVDYRIYSESAIATEYPVFAVYSIAAEKYQEVSANAAYGYVVLYAVVDGHAKLIATHGTPTAKTPSFLRSLPEQAPADAPTFDTPSFLARHRWTVVSAGASALVSALLVGLLVKRSCRTPFTPGF